MIPDDEELVRKVVDNDDREAFGQLVDKHKRGVFALLHRLLGNRPEVEDIAQNVFLAAYRGLAAFKGSAQFSTWIYRIAYNQAVSELRKRKSIAAHELPEAAPEDGKPEQPAADPKGPDQLTNVLRNQVWSAVNKLPVGLRATIELYYGRGLRYPEIAEALSMPLGTVKTHMHRAREQLREMLLERKSAIKD